jgi:hypothetical protein
VKLSKLFRIRRSRRFPIKRDGEGRSLRARCFELFEQSKRPAEVAGELMMKKNTAFRYLRDWRRLDPYIDRQYAFTKQLFRKEAPERDSNIEIFSKMLGIEKEEFETILSQPHGLRRFLSGKSYFPINADVDHKRHVALELAVLISDHLITEGGNFEDVYYAISRYMWEHKKHREDVDANIQEWNKDMEFIHAILAADIENERKGSIKPDKFSENEINDILQYEIKSQIKELETLYWSKIARLMFDGLTEEEAREKLYQDLLGKGDIKVAKSFREFQNKVHPLKSGDQSPPSVTPPPLASIKNPPKTTANPD